MPTYLLHGFRWHRAAIRIHIILQDLEDAAAEWIVAPATSNTLLNSFYTLYDFLPPSSPPAPTHTPPTPSYPPPPPPPIPDDPPEEIPPPRSLRKKNTRSMVSLRSLGRKQRPANLEAPPPLPTARGNDSRKPSSSASEFGAKLTPMTSRSTSNPYTNGKIKKPPSFNDWSVVKLVEQYDPSDMYSVSQPYAYVADYMVEVTLGASLLQEMAKYEARLKEDDPPMGRPATPATPDVGSPGMSARDIRRKSRRLGWFEKLRDGLQAGEDIGWYVVVCGDEERASPSMDLSRSRPSTRSTGSGSIQQRTPRSAGLKGFFGRKKQYPDEYLDA